MGRVRFDALVFSRYAASCWIVAYHYYTPAGGGVYQWAGVDVSATQKHTAIRVFRFGTFLTQYFFILSGFVLAVARLSSSRPDDMKPTWQYVAERLTTTYPAYLLSLVLMLFNLAGSDSFTYAAWQDWVNYGMHLTLTQAWWPNMICAAAGKQDGRVGGKFYAMAVHWNVPAWFMSALAFYWILFKPMYRVLRRLPRRTLLPAAVGLWASSGAAGVDMWLRDLSLVDAPHDFYRYNPLMYVHVFAFGMVLARIYLEYGFSSSDTKTGGTKDALEAVDLGLFPVPVVLHWVVAHGATIGYIIYIAIALNCTVEGISGMKTYDDKHAGGRFYFLHNGGLAPLNALIIFGLCSETDRVAMVFKNAWFQWVGAISYAQYILQAVVFHLVRAAYEAAAGKDAYYVSTGWAPFGSGYGAYQTAPYGVWLFQVVLPTTLFTSAFLVHYYISVPVGAHLRKQLDAWASASRLVTKQEPTYGALERAAVSGGKAPSMV